MSDHHHQEAHVIEYGKYIFIWLALLAFTGITVTAAGIGLGNWTVVVALLIASTKSWFVLNYFMHLKYEDRVFKLFIAVAFITFAIFITFTFWDYSFTR
ncbi:MAG: cytochrome C oxidase subunit IV family protein [Ignavibacteriales bacterium]|nr:cytochrome C oxidase subunit IV family protein [Ignavibacteriales bacterium]